MSVKSLFVAPTRQQARLVAGCWIHLLPDTILSILYSFFDKRDGTRIANCSRTLHRVWRCALTRSLHRGPIIGNPLYIIPELIKKPWAFYHFGTRFFFSFFFVLFPPPSRSACMVSTDICANGCLVLAAKADTVVAIEACGMVSVFRISVSRSRTMDLVRHFMLANFSPISLAANEERNECYIRSVGPNGDKICVFDMTEWTLQKIWSVEKRHEQQHPPIDYRAQIAFNKINGLLYFNTNHDIYVMNPVTGIVRSAALLCSTNPDLRSLLNSPHLIGLWTGNLASWGNCLVVCFCSESVIHVYNCDTRTLSLSFPLRHRETGAVSVQCYREEFYVGEIYGRQVSVYSSNGIYQRKLSCVALMKALSATRVSPCISVHAPSQTMAILECSTGKIAVVE